MVGELFVSENFVSELFVSERWPAKRAGAPPQWGGTLRRAW